MRDRSCSRAGGRGAEHSPPGRVSIFSLRINITAHLQRFILAYTPRLRSTPCRSAPPFASTYLGDTRCDTKAPPDTYTRRQLSAIDHDVEEDVSEDVTRDLQADLLPWQRKQRWKDLEKWKGTSDGAVPKWKRTEKWKQLQ